MKFDIVSDLHVDFYKSKRRLDWAELRNEGSDILVIAGDTANSVDRCVKEIKRAAEAYPRVLFIDGNHEHYEGKTDVEAAMLRLATQTRDIPNVTYLDSQKTVLIDGTVFIGANGWYDFSLAPPPYTEQEARLQWYISNSDSMQIRFGDTLPDQLAAEQAGDLSDVVEILQDDSAAKRIVVITHTVPHPRGLIVKGEPIWDQLNGSFANGLMRRVAEADRAEKIVLWQFGHTHYGFDFDDRHIRYVANPRGYPGERSGKYQPVQIDLDDHRKSAFEET